MTIIELAVERVINTNVISARVRYSLIYLTTLLLLSMWMPSLSIPLLLSLYRSVAGFGPLAYGHGHHLDTVHVTIVGFAIERVISANIISIRTRSN
jgi:hypothetical protein